MPEVTGIGGVFIRARDADALRTWYSEHLGIPIDGDSGAQFTWTAGGSTVFSIFAASSPYFGRTDQQCIMPACSRNFQRTLNIFLSLYF